MYKYIYIVLIVFIASACNDIWSEGEGFKVENNPVVCFNEVTDACGGENYKIPMPSSYMEAALPEGLTINIDPKTPFTVKFGDKIKKETMTSENVIVLKNGSVLPARDYLIDYFKDAQGNVDESILSITSSSGEWDSEADYVVILLNGFKSQNNKVFGKSKAWFMAISEFPLVDENGKSVLEGVSDEDANLLQKLRNELSPKLDLLTKLLGINRFNVLLLWSFRFEKPVVCFKDTIKGCKNDPIPIPSDLMALALPENTHLNIPDTAKFSVKFSEAIEPESLKDNILILKNNQNGISFITPEQIKISYDEFNEDGVTDTSKVFIALKDGKWDFNSTYLVILKKGIKTAKGELFNASATTFFARMEDSLFADTELTQLQPWLIPLFKDKTEDAKALEMLRLKYKELLDASSVNRDDIIMFWSVTFPQSYIISCFKSNDFPGCEDATEAPLPSDFIMHFEYDENGNELSRHIDLPVSEDDPMKNLTEAINTLDGWSTSKGFSITLSDDVDMNTVITDLSDIPNTMPTLWVLKVSIDENRNIHATPVPVKTRFVEEWNTLEILPLSGTWEENTKYLIIMTDEIRGKRGEKLVKPLVFSLMSEKESLLNEDKTAKYQALEKFDEESLMMLEGARAQFDKVYKALELPLSEGGLGLDRKNISMLWTVTTQTVTLPLKGIISEIKNNNSIPKHTLVIDQVIENSQIYNHYSNYINNYWMQGGTVSFAHVSKIALGKFTVPWFLNEQYVFDVEKLQGNLTEEDLIEVPVMIAFPQEEQNVKANNKVIIFQHGINDSKEEVLPILDTFTQRGYIVVSMDLPLHGERSLDLTDLKDNFSPFRNIPDGVPDNSGMGFLGLNVFATRDLIRQSVIEQTILTANLTAVDFNNLNGDIKFSTVDANYINYFGFSLGTIIGNIYVSIDELVNSAVLNAPGGVLTDIVMNTKESISKPLFDALDSMGLSKGSKKLSDFMYLAQVVLDPADPVNYKRDNLPVLIQKSIGDPVMPNDATDILGVKLGLINPLTNEKNPLYFKEYQMTDYDPSRLYWHSFTMIDKCHDVTSQAREDLMNFFDNN